MTYGLGRAEILSAQANGVTLLVLALLIVYDAIARLVSPPHVQAAAWCWWSRSSGIAVNLVAARIAAPAAGSRSLNVEGSFRHILTDLYGVHRDGGRGGRDPRDRILARRPDRVAAGRGADAARRRTGC